MFLIGLLVLRSTPTNARTFFKDIPKIWSTNSRNLNAYPLNSVRFCLKVGIKQDSVSQTNCKKATMWKLQHNEGQMWLGYWKWAQSKYEEVLWSYLQHVGWKIEYTTLTCICLQIRSWCVILSVHSRRWRRCVNNSYYSMVRHTLISSWASRVTMWWFFGSSLVPTCGNSATLPFVFVAYARWYWIDQFYLESNKPVLTRLEQDVRI